MNNIINLSDVTQADLIGLSGSFTYYDYVISSGSLLNNQYYQIPISGILNNTLEINGLSYYPGRHYTIDASGIKWTNTSNVRMGFNLRDNDYINLHYTRG